jgi:hypothetical protein
MRQSVYIIKGKQATSNEAKWVMYEQTGHGIHDGGRLLDNLRLKIWYTKRTSLDEKPSGTNVDRKSRIGSQDSRPRLSGW